MPKLKKCSSCKRKVEGVRKINSIQLCPRCRGADDSDKIRGRGDQFLPPDLRAMARDMGLEDELNKMGGDP